MRLRFLLIPLVLVMAAEVLQSAELYDETYRPQFHFSAKSKGGSTTPTDWFIKTANTICSISTIHSGNRVTCHGDTPPVRI